MSNATGPTAIASGNVKSATLEATIIRADGRVENLGVIGRYERGLAGRLSDMFQDFLRRLTP